jgi:uncharacterized oxidoreductase
LLIHEQPLRKVVEAIFAAAGCSVVEAERIAEALVGANLTGHDSHGVGRTLRYVEWLRDGVQLADQKITVLAEGDAFALIDGNYGFGQTIGVQAVQLGLTKARTAGVSVIALRHSGHLGRIGEWAEMAAAAGFVSIHFVNVAGGLLVAPFGAVDRRMSTNPVCVGVPVADSPPVILDFATSVVAEGKVQVALEGGAALPADSLIGLDGQLTADPTVLYGERTPGRSPNPRKGSGAMVAMGLHKGSGLSMICELLAGALTGSGCAGPGRERFANGMLSVYVDPARLDVDGAVAADISGYLEWFKSARAAGDGGEVLSPGEPERRKRAQRMADGVSIPDDTWEAILNAAELSGLGRAEAEAIAGTA